MVQTDWKYVHDLCKVEQECVLGRFHVGINDRYLLGLRTA
jgi:hypothetical protein